MCEYIYQTIYIYWTFHSDRNSVGLYIVAVFAVDMCVNNIYFIPSILLCGLCNMYKITAGMRTILPAATALPHTLRNLPYSRRSVATEMSSGLFGNPAKFAPHVDCPPVFQRESIIWVSCWAPRCTPSQSTVSRALHTSPSPSEPQIRWNLGGTSTTDTIGAIPTNAQLAVL